MTASASDASGTFVSLTVDDGTTMRAFIARPPTASGAHTSTLRPGLLMFQEAYGVNAHIQDVARRFAREGYIAIAPELFHRSAPAGFDAPYDNFSVVMPHVQALTVAGMSSDIQAAHAWLLADRDTDSARVSAVGYCMGGRVAYLANTLLPLSASVSYYGGGIVPLLDRANFLHGPQLFFWGGLDAHIPPEQQRSIVDALRAAGKTFANVEFSDAGHAFFCDARPAYHRRAAAESWALTLAYLREQAVPHTP